jgi:preprotein translocase subunit SecG
MATLITVIHVLVSLFLILVVLLQAGKGGGMGIAFGGGGSNTVFGGSGAGNFLTRLTVIAAFLFMITSMTLAYLASTAKADPLKELSTQSRRNAEDREKSRQRILETTKSPDGEGGEGAAGGEGGEGGAGAAAEGTDGVEGAAGGEADNGVTPAPAEPGTGAIADPVEPPTPVAAPSPADDRVDQPVTPP